MTTTFTITAAARGLLAAGVIGVITATPKPAAVASANVTTIAKNQVWPVKGLITMDPCAVAACQEV